MKAFIISIALAFVSSHATAATCLEQANEKKLKGHAQESFIKKCAEEAKKGCESLAKTRELNGSAKRSFVRKCVADVVGKK